MEIQSSDSMKHLCILVQNTIPGSCFSGIGRANSLPGQPKELFWNDNNHFQAVPFNFYFMSVFFNKIERGNPMDTTAPKKWYATLKTINQVKEKEVAQLISDETTLNRKEAEMSLDQLEKVLIRLLLESNSVELGDWGSFHLTCNSEGVETKDALTASNIKGVNIRFVPGKVLRNALKNATFKYTESIVS